MSKKKQLDGKKTKLDKLPLTRALTQHLDDVLSSAPATSVPEPVAQQLILSWERLEEGAAGLLTAAYVLVVHDLLSLKDEVPWAGEERLTPEEIIPPGATSPRRVKQALRLAREELSDLYRLLSV